LIISAVQAIRRVVFTRTASTELDVSGCATTDDTWHCGLSTSRRRTDDLCLRRRRPEVKGIDPGDLTAQRAIREKLHCRSFDWFMKEIAYDIPL